MWINIQYTIEAQTVTDEHIRSISTSERSNKGRTITFTIKRVDMNGITKSDVMMAHGFHPAGYGSAFGEQEVDGVVTFNCSGSCD